MGSISGGGRYDNLTGVFGMAGLTGVGVSFGADRIYDVMLALDLFPETVTESIKYLFLNFGEKESERSRLLVSRLRSKGISCELYPDNVKIGKQMTYANNNNIPYVAIIGESELENGTVTVKDMNAGTQSTISQEELLIQE